MTRKDEPTATERFEALAKKVLSVSKKEVERREREWKKQRVKKK